MLAVRMVLRKPPTVTRNSEASLRIVVPNPNHDPDPQACEPVSTVLISRLFFKQAYSKVPSLAPTLSSVNRRQPLEPR
jgi:hypothetical protein